MPPPKPWEVSNGDAPTTHSDGPAVPMDSTPGAKQLSGQVALSSPAQGGTLSTNNAVSGSNGYGGLNSGGNYNSMGGGYGSMGMGGGYGSMMGGMGGYGGMGMGGMGMGYGGMMGGMGMGMGGMGMMGMGMGMMGMSEQEQRGQMAIMMLSRVAEIAHAFTQVLQMTFGSVLNFAGSYVGLTAQYQQLAQAEEAVDPEQEYRQLQQQRKAIQRKRNDVLRRAQQKHTPKSLFWSSLRKAAIFAIAVFLARRILGWIRAPKALPPPTVLASM